MTEKEVIKTLKQAVNLIESQQAKINKLEKARQKQAYLLCNLRGQKYELMNRISAVKNEAYKEFAERLKIYSCRLKDGHDMVDTICIDNLLKEMVGEGE